MLKLLRLKLILQKVNKLINKAKKLNDDLKELDVSKEYFNLKKLISEDSYLNDLLDVINKTQKEMKEHYYLEAE